MRGLRTFLFMVFYGLQLAACNSDHIVPQVTKRQTVLPAPVAASTAERSYQHFMDSILSRKDIVYDSLPLQVGEVWKLTARDGTFPIKPKSFQFGREIFKMLPQTMQIVNEEGDRLYHIRYETDSGFSFHFKGQKYGWAKANYYMCNGSGCLEQYYLFADFQRKRLHVFVTFDAPEYDLYFGDLDGDDQLDFLIPAEFTTAHSSSPYDSAERLTLTKYSIGADGEISISTKNGRACRITGRFRQERSAVANFQILEANL